MAPIRRVSAKTFVFTLAVFAVLQAVVIQGTNPPAYISYCAVGDVSTGAGRNASLCPPPPAPPAPPAFIPAPPALPAPAHQNNPPLALPPPSSPPSSPLPHVAPPPAPLLASPPTPVGTSPSTALGPSPPAPVGTSPVTTPSVASKSQAGLIAGICAAIFGAALMGLVLFYFHKHRNMQKSSVTPDFRPYTFREMKSMTRNFNHSELLSCGAFGDVYRGTQSKGGNLLAVKRIKHGVEEGEASFLAEANSLRQIRHRNLLQLRGWCEVKEGLFLVYDFMSNGSLDKWLHPKRNPNQVTVMFKSLSWDVRFSILSGVASALEYLHEGWKQCVLHRDIKSSNVLFDADFNPYLGNFGLARLVDQQKLDKTTTPAGTFGYMAPEMHYTGKATDKTDVYAFGVLVLEVVCGKRPFIPGKMAMDWGIVCYWIEYGVHTKLGTFCEWSIQDFWNLMPRVMSMTGMS